MSQQVETRRALCSVWDKTGVVEFARELSDLGWEIVSSGGTARALEEAGVPVVPLATITGFPEMLDHRVVSLHPKVHGGILADRGKASHLADMAEHGIVAFDLVVSNLYPFLDAPDIETIDIGGPAMTRAAAKNHAWVAVVTSPAQYADVLAEIRAHGNTTVETRRALALEAFALTASYDAAVVRWLQADDELPRHLVLPLQRTDEALRYGENPHQRAARYRLRGTTSWFDAITQHSGVALSYLNLYDADAARRPAVARGDQPAVAISKPATPCGAAVAADLATAYQRALECDERSAFGGIVACNRPVDADTVARMVEGPQADVVLAPGYAPGTLDALVAKRKNTRLIEAPAPGPWALDVRQVSGGFLVQTPHHFAAARPDWRVVTKRAPTEAEWADAEFAWRVCGWVKSNAIVLAKDRVAWGIGAGQQNRVESGEIAAKKAAGRAQGGACASDAFFPFPDGLEVAAGAGATVVVQPGGAMRDDAVIERADELGLAMVFTGERHFVH
ncbi:MAG: bifunctional phosphoribosylaminoimidazolecarboxamide formyltransferase/IMP cyclohydrolase [Actinomycetota bacterium]